MEKSIEQMVLKRDVIFRNAVSIEVVMELGGIFGGSMVLAEVAVVALSTTLALWHVFLSSDKRLQRRVAR